MLINGNLESKYVKEKAKVDIIKKQKPEQKLNSLLEMIDSTEKRNLCEGLSQLASFVSTTISLPYYNRIIEALSKCMQT